MLAYLVADGAGAADRILWKLAQDLRSKGIRLAGAVQDNPESADGGRCHMDLHILTGDSIIRISQNLGPLAQGCRLDPAELERAVGLVTSTLTGGPDLLIINKFGKQELGGRGFRPVIGEALGLNIPVLTAVNADCEAGFLDWAEDLAERLPANPAALLEWGWRRAHGKTGRSTPVTPVPRQVQ